MFEPGMIDDKEFAKIAASPFGVTLASIAVDYLNWRPRMERAEADFQHGSRDQNAKDVPFPSPHLKETFREYVQRRYHDLPQEDASAAIGLLFDHCPRLTDWLDLMREAFQVRIEIEDDQPRISINGAADWIKLIDRFDPDALVSYDLARRGLWIPGESLNKWGVTTLIGAHDLGVHLSEGVADLHIHLGGIRSGQVFWRNILTERVQIDHVPVFAPGVLAMLDPITRQKRVAQRDRIVELIEEIKRPFTPLGRLWAGSVSWRSRVAEKERTRLADARLRERGMMAHAWHALRSGEQEGALPKVALMLEHHFDRYLFAKNTFLAQHMQPSVTNPGLDAFRRFFHSTEPTILKQRRPRRLGGSAKVWSRGLGEFGEYLAQSPTLRRVELRTGPQKSMRDYQRLFMAWELVEREFNLSLDIRFAIHFKRSLDKPKSRAEEEELRNDPGKRVRDLLVGLDRDSSTLHQYLRHPSARPYAWRVSRLDFAGSERHCPSDLAAFCVNLTRGDDDSLRMLDSYPCDKRLHRNWLYFRKQGLAHPRFESPVVGVTCHAGEDYAHPIEGIYAVASAARNFKMRAGDTIGHGLALGENIASYDRHHGRNRLTQRGNQWDAMLWLYAECIRNAPGDLRTRADRLESWLRDEAQRIYGDGLLTKVSILQLSQGLLAERTKPVVAERARNNTPVVDLRRKELFDRECSNRRLETVPIDDEVYQQGDLIQWVKEKVRNDIAETGIVLEFNPSSNMRVAGAGAIDRIPFMAMLNAVERHILGTLNTDNPGVFGTRIENEYALVMRALQDANVSRAAALRILERLRDVGCRFVSWPPRSKPDARELAAENSGSETG